MSRFLLRLAVGCFALLSLPASALNILLTNDDGWDAPGIQAVYRALVAAGHEVTLVAPASEQSGRGGAMSTDVGGYVDVVRREERMWSVHSTPTDAVRAGLDVIMGDNPPDVVISGANFGQNLGRAGAHQSGTVNAALQAAFRGVPAIAFSVGVRFEEHAAEPRPFPSTLAAFEPAAELLAQLLVDLEKAGQPSLLPEGLALSVNVPVPYRSEHGLRLAPLSSAGNIAMYWRVGEREFGPDGGALRIDAAPVPPEAAAPGDDVDLFSRGYVTVTPINGSADSWEPVPGLASFLSSPAGKRE